MKKIFLLSLVVLGLTLTSCGKGLISKQEAKDAALKHAGFKTEDVNFVKTEYDSDDGKSVYEVEFYTKDFKEYDYEIDAKTGEVISFDEDAEDYNRGSNSTSTTANTNTTANNNSSGNDLITVDRAKEIAVKKVPGASVTDIKKFDFDAEDGRIIYEGTLVYDKTEYEFDIDAKTGEIIKWEQESVLD
jgi:uncharacterized membrane protein YkoI